MAGTGAPLPGPCVTVGEKEASTGSYISTFTSLLALQQERQQPMRPGTASWSERMEDLHPPPEDAAPCRQQPWLRGCLGLAANG